MQQLVGFPRARCKPTAFSIWTKLKPAQNRRQHWSHYNHHDTKEQGEEHPQHIQIEIPRSKGGLLAAKALKQRRVGTCHVWVVLCLRRADGPVERDALKCGKVDRPPCFHLGDPLIIRQACAVHMSGGSQRARGLKSVLAEVPRPDVDTCPPVHEPPK